MYFYEIENRFAIVWLIQELNAKNLESSNGESLRNSFYHNIHHVVIVIDRSLQILFHLRVNVDALTEIQNI